MRKIPRQVTDIESVLARIGKTDDGRLLGELLVARIVQNSGLDLASNPEPRAIFQCGKNNELSFIINKLNQN